MIKPTINYMAGWQNKGKLCQTGEIIYLSVREVNSINKNSIFTEKYKLI